MQSRRSDTTVRSPRRGGTVGSNPIYAVAQYARLNGMSSDRLENILGMRMADLQTVQRLPAMMGPHLFSTVLDEGLGAAPSLEIAQQTSLRFLGGLEQVILTAPSVRQTLETIAETFPAFHNQLHARVEETATSVCFAFRFNGTETDNGACNEVVLAVLQKALRMAFGRAGQPSEVCLRYTQNGLRDAYRDFYHCAVTEHSNDESFGLVFQKSALEQTVSTFDAARYERAVQRVSDLARQRQMPSRESDFHELENAAIICGRNGVFTTRAISNLAGLKQRTAQRVALANGTSLQNLSVRARLSRLNDYLARDPDADAETLATLVGLSDSRSFRRALKDWTGETLTSYRRRYK